MSIEEGFFEASDGIRLFYRFQSGTSPRNLIALVHGHGEHSGRYTKFFSRLEDLGRPIAAFDLRGCGRSGGRWVYVSKFEDYLDDLTSLVNFLEAKHHLTEPVTLFGNSLGGLIVTAWAEKESWRVSKLILASPLFEIPMSGLLRALVPVVNRLVPGWVIHNPIHPPWLTHDLREVEKYRKDPLIRRRITIRLVHEMLRYGSHFNRREISLACPVTVLMAEQDFVVNPEATRRFFKHLTAPEKELHTFPGFFHEIFNETGQDQAFAKLRDCLTR